jgi:hypothetical protein
MRSNLNGRLNGNLSVGNDVMINGNLSVGNEVMINSSSGTVEAQNFTSNGGPLGLIQLTSQVKGITGQRDSEEYYYYYLPLNGYYVNADNIGSYDDFKKFTWKYNIIANGDIQLMQIHAPNADATTGVSDTSGSGYEFQLRVFSPRNMTDLQISETFKIGYGESGYILNSSLLRTDGSGNSANFNRVGNFSVPYLLVRGYGVTPPRNIDITVETMFSVDHREFYHVNNQLPSGPLPAIYYG